MLSIRQNPLRGSLRALSSFWTLISYKSEQQSISIVAASLMQKNNVSSLKSSIE